MTDTAVPPSVGLRLPSPFLGMHSFLYTYSTKDLHAVVRESNVRQFYPEMDSNIAPSREKQPEVRINFVLRSARLPVLAETLRTRSELRIKAHQASLQVLQISPSKCAHSACGAGSLMHVLPRRPRRKAVPETEPETEVSTPNDLATTELLNFVPVHPIY